MEYKTNEKHFKYFQDRCEYWLEFLGLKSWEVYYKHEEEKEGRASCVTNYAGRAATLRLNTTWNAKPSREQLNISALHECLEVLLSPLWGQASARTWDREEYEQEHHAIIRVLEKVLIQRG